MQPLSALALVLLPLSLACRSSFPEREAHLSQPWNARFLPPSSLRTESLLLEPLNPRHVELDYAAFMSSRERLQAEMPFGGWPSEDMSLEENRADLERHWSEYEHREAYAYTVLNPEGDDCQGCVYVYPAPAEMLAEHGLPANVCSVTFWVDDEALAAGAEEELVRALLDWFERDWPWEGALFGFTPANERAHALCASLGMRPIEVPEFDALYWEP